jgi:hypothetical protein
MPQRINYRSVAPGVYEASSLDMQLIELVNIVEFAADHVLTLAPGNSDGMSMTTDPLMLSVVKNRHGETGSVGIARDPLTLRMAESGATVKTAYSAEVRASWASPA